MARVQYGAIVTGLKGNIAGHTFQNGNINPVLRSKGYRKGSNTATRQLQTTTLASVTSSWRSLTDNDREQWNGSSGNWPFKDKFGNTYYSNGYQKYVAESVALRNLGFPLITTPDTPLSADPMGVFSLSLLDPADMFVVWTISPSIDQFIQVFASAPLSAGRNNNNQRFRYIAQYNAGGSTDINFASDYQNIFGQPPSGSKVVVKTQVRTQQFPIIQFPTIMGGIVG